MKTTVNLKTVVGLGPGLGLFAIRKDRISPSRKGKNFWT